MDLSQSIRELITGIGLDSIISSSAYDTAWLARLGELDSELSEKALNWLREHQLADGSWGTSQPKYYHERVICTLASMTVLAKTGLPQDQIRCQRAQLALQTATKGLLADPAGATIGFEMIVPTLLTEAEEYGVFHRNGSSTLNDLVHHRAKKLASLPGGMVNRSVTVAFSTEMVGLDGLNLLDVPNLQEANGSVAYSPAATVFFARHVQPEDRSALSYLRKVAGDGKAPYIAPIEIFERGWALWNLALTGPLDAEIMSLCQPHLDFMERDWIPGKGIAASAGLTLIDGDTTGIVHNVLTHFGRSVDLEGVLNYETEDHFRCFPLEANPSISTNIHILGALHEVGLTIEHAPVQKILQFLRRTQTMRLFWFDKWHASPYYSTAHAIIACIDFDSELVDDAVYWLLETQQEDGSWGYYMPTAEETAYCLQALVVWKRHGHPVPPEVLARGAAWLSAHTDPPYPSLWIGKSLYCPQVVVRSAILSALIMADQG